VYQSLSAERAEDKALAEDLAKGIKRERRGVQESGAGGGGGGGGRGGGVGGRGAGGRGGGREGRGWVDAVRWPPDAAVRHRQRVIKNDRIESRRLANVVEAGL